MRVASFPYRTQNARNPTTLVPTKFFVTEIYMFTEIRAVQSKNDNLRFFSVSINSNFLYVFHQRKHPKCWPRSAPSDQNRQSPVFFDFLLITCCTSFTSEITHFIHDSYKKHSPISMNISPPTCMCVGSESWFRSYQLLTWHTTRRDTWTWKRGELNFYYNRSARGYKKKNTHTHKPHAPL